LTAYSTCDNGNVFQVLNNVESTRSATFTYDSLNRLTQANTVNTTSANANCWGESYTIDAWGNLTNIAGAPGMAGSCSYESLNAAPASTANQLTGYSYDAAGNLLLNSDFYYDAENRLYNPAAPYTYWYDADGLRTRKAASATVGTIYWPGSSGEILTEANGSGTVSEDYIYFNGSRIARVDRPSGTVHYYFSDQLGSASTITSSSGSVEACYYYSPYGGLVGSCGSDTNHYLFTGKERDNDSGEFGLDNFINRHYGSSLERFMQPDPGGGHLEDPQTLNRYAYVRNNPLSLTDPTGLDFYLSCGHTDNNGSTCQQMQVGTDKNGNAQMAWVQGVTGDNGFTATQIGNDANGNLVDRTTGTGTYTADVTGSGVQLSNNGGATSATGVFLNKDVDLSGTNQVQSYDTVVRAGTCRAFCLRFRTARWKPIKMRRAFLHSTKRCTMLAKY
jgi:RHS repeat-associated protein